MLIKTSEYQSVSIKIHWVPAGEKGISWYLESGLKRIAWITRSTDGTFTAEGITTIFQDKLDTVQTSSVEEIFDIVEEKLQQYLQTVLNNFDFIEIINVEE